MSLTQAGNPLPVALPIALAASAAINQYEYVCVDPSTGYGNNNAGTTPDQICTGTAQQDTTAIATAGMSSVTVNQNPVWGEPASTIANDGFAITDVGVPFFIAGVKTPGKLTNYGGKRTVGGLILGLDPRNGGTPIQLAGVVPQVIAKSALLSNDITIAKDAFVLTANTTRAETSMPRLAKVPGKVVEVRISADAGFTAHDTNYWTITVAKRTNATPGTAVTVATKTLKITGGTGDLTAWKYKTITLSSTAADLDFLEDDEFTVVCTSETTAAGIARFTVEVIAKVG